MATDADHKSVALYRSVMEEVKVRVESINTITRDQRGIPSPLVYEYCCLQLRMTCELIALGCLVAHGDIVANSPKSLRKAYDPKEILSQLEVLHFDFYPVPFKPEQTANGWNMAEYGGGSILSKVDLLKLWSRSGDVLHRGNLKKLVSQKMPFQNTFQDVSEWGQKILNLLSAHRIAKSGGSQVFITFLQVNDLGGATQVVIAEAPFDHNERGRF